MVHIPIPEYHYIPYTGIVVTLKFWTVHVCSNFIYLDSSTQVLYTMFLASVSTGDIYVLSFVCSTKALFSQEMIYACVCI